MLFPKKGSERQLRVHRPPFPTLILQSEGARAGFMAILLSYPRV